MAAAPPNTTTNNNNNNNNNSSNNNNNNSSSSSTNETDEFIKKSRVTRAAPPKPAYDPLQFVQIKPAKLYDLNKAKPSTERKVVEVKTAREVEDAEEWQCNLDNWKSSRRKRVEHIIDKITEAKKIEQEEVCRGRKKSKTFSEMLENSGSRRRFILPGTEDDDDAGSFSDDLQDNRDPSKQSYKDESTDERGTDDTGSSCSSKVTDGESKTPELDESHELPEMNEFSLAIENYKSKFPMTQNRSSTVAITATTSGNSATIATTTTTTSMLSVVSSIESNGNDIYESNSSSSVSEECKEKMPPTEMIATASTSSVSPAMDEDDRRVLFEFAGNRSENVRDELSEKSEAAAKVNVIERRRLFEQFQRLSCASDPASSAIGAPTTKSNNNNNNNNGGQESERYSEGTQSSTDEPVVPGSSEWFSAGSIKERRAIFERYQSNEMMTTEGSEMAVGGGRSRSSSTTVVSKSRSESNFGFVNGTTGRFELTLAQLKRNGTDYCEDSGIQSTTDLSRSSVVSQADDHEPSLLLLSEDALRKSPNRSSATLDSASEFSDTDCSNGQLLDNALDVAFEEMDSELHGSCTNVDDQSIPTEQQEQSNQQQETAEFVPLDCVAMPLPAGFATAAKVANEDSNNAELVLLPLPKSTLTPPKEKPPPPPVDDEPEQLERRGETPPATTVASAGITSWMQRNEIAALLQANQNGHQDGGLETRALSFYEEQKLDPSAIELRPGEFLDLSIDEQWRSLESFEVVQQIEHQQQQQQQQNNQNKEQELQQREKDQQELLVYSNQIEAQSQHHHQMYDPGDHEEIVSVERELLQIEQEELQRRREKQMFYEKLTNADNDRLAVNQIQHQHQKQQLQPQLLQQSQPIQPKSVPNNQRVPVQQDTYYETHHLHHQQQHHHENQQQHQHLNNNHPNNPHNHHFHHHRASMPTIDSRSLQNVNSYASYDTPFVDDGHPYEMTSLHRESMPNLSQAAASSSHPSSLSSYGEEAYSANSATSFDGTGWPPVDSRPAFGAPLVDRRPLVAPRPALNGFLERPPMANGGGAGSFPVGAVGGDRQRPSNNMFEQQPKDNKQNAYHTTMVNRSSGHPGGVPNNMPYGQHWLVQEAEQRRIEQHQKNASNTTKRPLPKFVIDAITQRVQKLNAGSPEQSERSNISEDSDLAMLHSMKHNHQQPHHHSQQLPPVHHHHQQQQPLPPLPPAQQQHQQQQQYSNTSDKVLSVSGKKECSHCRIELGKGAAMAIESLGLFYHIECFKCCVCHVKLGDGTNGIDVRVRKYRLHCQNCFSSEDGVKFSCV